MQQQQHPMTSCCCVPTWCRTAAFVFTFNSSVSTCILWFLSVGGENVCKGFHSSACFFSRLDSFFQHSSVYFYLWKTLKRLHTNKKQNKSAPLRGREKSEKLEMEGAERFCFQYLKRLWCIQNSTHNHLFNINVQCACRLRNGFYNFSTFFTVTALPRPAVLQINAVHSVWCHTTAWNECVSCEQWAHQKDVECLYLFHIMFAR